MLIHYAFLKFIFAMYYFKSSSKSDNISELFGSILLEIIIKGPLL